MSDHAARFARDAPGVETAEPLHTTPSSHVYTARLADGPGEVRIVTPAPAAPAEEQEAVTERLETWESLGSHPSITTVHAQGEVPRPWLAVTATGQPLSAVAPLPVEDARSVVADVAEALRDGANAGHDRVPVEPADVRVVKPTDTSNTESESAGASLDWPTRSPENADQSPYSPPEAVDGESGAARAAVFRLGALAYYAVTGQSPVEDGDEIAIREQRWPSPSFVNSDVPEAFDEVVETALDPDPTERYDSPYEFKRALLFESQPAPGPEPGDQPPTDESAGSPVGSGMRGETGQTTQADEPNDIAGFRRRTVLGALGFGAVAAAGGTWFTATQLLRSETEEFPMFRYDAANTGYAPDAVGPTAGVTEAWSLDTGTSVRSSPVVADETVVINDGDGVVYALNTRDGSERWRDHTEVPDYISAALGDGVAYLAVRPSEQADAITARDLSDGSERWRSDEPDRPVRTPVLADDRLYVFGNQLIYAIDADGEGTEWVAEGVSVTSLTGAVSEGVLYVSGLVDGEETSSPWEDRTRGVIALDASDGSKRWVFDLGTFVSSSPAVVDGMVYVGSDDDGLVAIDADEGEERWRFETDGPVPASPAVTDHGGGTVYAASVDGHVYAIDREQHDERWRFDTGSQIVSSPAVVSDTVYVGNDDGDVVALDAEDGEERWRFETGDSVISSPAVVSNTVFVGSDDGHIYALTEP